MKRLAIVCALLPAATSLARKPAPEAMGPTSEAVTPQILDAIAEEMNRDMSRLVIDGAPKPYQIAYKITEVDVNNVSASLGQTLARQNRHFVNLEVRVRVGSPDLDNSNFVVPDASEINGTATQNLPLEATPALAKRVAWLTTDSAYKKALIQLQAKLEARRAGSVRVSDAPSLAPAKPVVGEDPVLVPALESLDDLESRVKTLSANFRDHPELRDSRVAATSYVERRWYLTTEGTSVTDTRRASGIVIAVEGQADDGQLLHNYFLRYGRTAKDLPSDKELEAESKKLAESIKLLAKAPLIDHYTGPVLFEGEGAVGMVRATLAANLGGTPLPEGLTPQEARQFGGQLTEKVGLKVVAPMLTIVDDPTAHDAEGKALIGGYRIDDEGVQAQKVDVIKDGMLKTLLTSRTPSAKGQTSNGHARVPGEGGAFRGSATNLIVNGRGGAPRRALEGELVTMARGDGMKYGLVIRRFDDAAVTGAPDFTRRELFQQIKSADIEAPPAAVLAYRVYPGGKEELVRGVQLATVPMRAWKDVTAVSTEKTVYNFLAPFETQLQLRLTGGTEEGFVPSGGIENAIVTPDLLFKELDVVGSRGGVRELPAVEKPVK
ncbi:MAG TPA: metallopeptidase TldD-related protein [Kofleriaceae bacterium]|nr:metallopeptidase TldD-related protein [Kofleriaceae bacterium]